MNESVINAAANRLGALASALAERQATAMGEAAGEAGSAVAALTACAKYPGETVAFFEPILGLTQSGTVRTFDRLVAAGLARREPGRDRRSVALHLTPAGRRALAKATRARERVLREALGTLGGAELRRLDRSVARLLAALPADRADARHICRHCDERACNAAGPCPVDAAVTGAGEPGYPASAPGARAGGA